MSLGTETIALLTRNLNVLNNVLSTAQHADITDSDRKNALHTLMMTAEAGSKLVEAVRADALTVGRAGAGVGVGMGVGVGEGEPVAATTKEREVRPVRPQKKSETVPPRRPPAPASPVQYPYDDDD